MDISFGRNEDVANQGNGWDEVIFLYNDETVTRTFGLMSTDHTYNVQNVVVISNNEVVKVPLVQATVKHEELYIAIDSQLHIFDENFSEQKSSLKTKSVIDSFAVSEDGNFILIGESSGVVSLIYIPLALTVLSHRLIEPESTESCFCDVAFSFKARQGRYDVVICGYNKIIYKISNINFEELITAVRENDVQKATQLRDQIKFSFLKDDDQEFAIKSCCFFEDSRGNFSVMVAGSGNIVLKVWSIEEEHLSHNIYSDVFDYSELTKIQMTRNNRHIIVLDSNNVLHILCSSTFILVKTWSNVSVSDFMYWESANNNTVENKVHFDSKLLVLTMPEENKTDFCMYNFPSFDLIYKLNSSSFTRLVNMPLLQDNLIIIEGILNEANSTADARNLVNNLKIKVIQEMMPDVKLSKLLKKKRFEEAENFGKSLGLNLQLVYWTWLNSLTEDVLLKNYETVTSDARIAIEEALFTVLNKLRNFDQLVEYCQILEMPTIELYKKLLLHIKTKIKTHKGSESHVIELDRILYRLFTCEYLFGSRNFCLKWNEFKNCNVAEEFVSLMKSKDFSPAVGLWLRHEWEILHHTSIEEFFQVIPNNIHCSEYSSWFYDTFLVTLIKSRPECLGMICDWLIAYSSGMEKHEKKDWPRNALKFIKKTLQIVDGVFNIEEKTTQLEFGVKLSVFQSCLSHLKENMKALEDLDQLTKCYKCQISYADFTQEDKMRISCELLNNVHDVESISGFLKGFLISYLRRYDLIVDQVLFQYISELLSYMKFSKVSWEDTDAEERIEAIFRHIVTDEYKCKTVLAYIFEAPWNECMEKLVAEVLTLNHLLVAEIKDGLKHVEIKKILYFYDIKNSSLSQGNLQLAIKYILTQDKPTSLNDALRVTEICEHYFSRVDVYLFRMKFLITHNRVDEIYELLKDIPIKYCVQSCTRFINFTWNLLNVSSYDSDLRNKCEEILYTKTALVVLRHLKTKITPFECEELRHIEATLESLCSLQVEFGIHLSPNDFEEISNREDTFINYVDKLLLENRDLPNETNDDRLENCSFRLGMLLGFTREKSLGLLLRKNIENGKLSAALKLLSDFSLDIEHCKPVHLITEIRISLQKLIPSSVEFVLFLLRIHKLISHLLIYCASENLQEFLTIAKWMSLVKRLTSDKEKMNVDCFSRLFYKSVFQEFSLVDNRDLTEMLFLIIGICYNFETEEKETNDDDIIKVGRKICIFLQDKKCLLQSLEIISELTLHFNQFIFLNSDKKKDVENYKDFFIFKKNVITSLFEKVLHSVEIDELLAFGLAFTLPKIEAKRLLKNVVIGNNSPKLFVTELGCYLGSMWDDLELTSTFLEWHNCVTWIKKFSELNISINIVVETASKNDWKQHMDDLAMYENIDLDVLEEFCYDFNLKFDDALFCYLENLILSIPLKTVSEEEQLVSPLKNASQRALAVDCVPREIQYSSEIADINWKIDEAIQKVDNKVQLFEKLKYFFGKICPYNYEAISIILRQMFILASVDHPTKLYHIRKKLTLLDFLNNYRRTQGPSENEISKMKSKAQIALQRLPFHSFFNENPWAIITVELNSETANLWHRVIDLLQLSSFDEVLAVSVQRELDNFNQMKPENDNFQTSRNGGFNLEKIFNIIDRVNDPIIKMSCAHHVTHNLPLGEDKVRAAKKLAELATTFVNDSKQSNLINNTIETHTAGKIKDYEKMCKRHSKSFLDIATEVTLLKNNLRMSEILKLIGKPEKLISYLYENFSLEQKDKSTDITSVAEEIASIYSINLADLQMKLAENWLIPSNRLLFKTTKQERDYQLEEHKRILRAAFVLKNFPPEEIVLFLLNKIFRENIHQTYVYKYRVLRCLLLIVDESKIKEHSRKMISDPRIQLRSFYYLAQLENLQLSMTLPIFQDTDMENVAVTIWKKINFNHENINLVINLCLDYKVKNIELWSELLEKLIFHKMIDELRKVLMFTLDISQLWETDVYTKAWSFLLLYLIEIESENNEEKERSCLQIVEIIFKCPVLLLECSQTLCTELFKVGYPALGIGCLLQMSVTHHLYLEPYTNATSMKLICGNLSLLKKKEIHFPQYLKVLEFVLNFMEKNCDYDLILDTHFYKDIILILVKENRVEKLVCYLYKIKRLEMCSELINTYFSNNPDSPIRLTCVNLKGKILVETFIKEITEF